MVIASISFGFRFRGRPFWRGVCGNPAFIECGVFGPKYPLDEPIFIAVFSLLLGLVCPLGDEPYCEYWHVMPNGVDVVVGDSNAIS